MQFQDYYKLLGIARTADEKEIKRAYLEMARKYHPDVNKAADAEERFKAINEAYQVLSDAEKRGRYDRFGSDWERYQAAPGTDTAGNDFAQWFAGQSGDGARYEYRTTGGEGFSDFFETLFGGGSTGRRGRRRTARRGEDHEQTVEIGLREAFSGTTRQFEMQVPESCPECGGDGFIGGELCWACGASGTTTRKSRIEVTIPAGVREGQKVRVAGAGGPGIGGGPRGDVYLRVRLRPESIFTIEGNDIKTEIDVPLYAMVLGGETIVPTLTGKLALTIPAETQNGRVFRLRGQGWPVNVGSKERGDLLAKVRVVLPAGLSERELDLFAQLRTERAAGQTAKAV